MERERRWSRWRQRSEQVSAILPRRGGAIGLPQIRQLWTAIGRSFFRFSVFIQWMSETRKTYYLPRKESTLLSQVIANLGL